MICQRQLGSGIPFKRDLMFTTQLSGYQYLVCEIWVRLVNVTFVLERGGWGGGEGHYERQIVLLATRSVCKDRK
jgi:hypothetical protein